jgi:hypothetical protein
MSFWQKFRECLVGLFAVSGNEDPGARRDLALSALMAVAALILIVYPSRQDPSERLRHGCYFGRGLDCWFNFGEAEIDGYGG